MFLSDEERRARISKLEESARENEVHANALEADAKKCRWQAEVDRKTAEYLRKATALHVSVSGQATQYQQ